VQSAAWKDLYMAAQALMLHCGPARSGIADIGPSPGLSATRVSVASDLGSVAAGDVCGNPSADRVVSSQKLRGPPR